MANFALPPQWRTCGPARSQLRLPLHLSSLFFTFPRLPQVWSNTIVIADFFGDRETVNWYFAAWVGMAIPAVYTLIGGMQASLLSDFVQTIFAYALLLLTYFTITARVGGAFRWRMTPAC